MRLRTIYIYVFFLSIAVSAKPQIPPGYYDAAAGLSGNSLKTALHNIIKNHTSATYSYLWTAFQTTDVKPNGKVWDIYSDNPGGTPAYEYTFITDQCGSASSEGDCYNREHSFPASWFNDASPMYTDLFHLYPTDGYVNNKRSNFPYGTVGSASWTSSNGSKLGSCDDPGYSGTVFEPINAYKGDLARTYFYMAVRYLGEDSGWPGSDMVNGSQLLMWSKSVLYSWHLNDPVSQKEIDRNNAVYDIQNNRNPFIDHPEWVGAIWGPNAGEEEQENFLKNIDFYPNPAHDVFHICGFFNETKLQKLEVYTEQGSLIQRNNIENNKISLDVTGYSNGIYFIKIFTSDKVFQKKMVVLR